MTGDVAAASLPASVTSGTSRGWWADRFHPWSHAASDLLSTGSGTAHVVAVERVVAVAMHCYRQERESR
jgi:hypothetical protein